MIEIIPNAHPVFVHFAVTVIVFTGLLQLVLWWSDPAKNSTVARTQSWLLGIGAFITIATLASGAYAASTVNHDSVSHLAMMDHRNWAVPTGLIYLLGVAVYFFMPKLRNNFAGLCFVIALLMVTVTAYKGGELVYRYGVGVLSLPEVSADGHGHDHEHGHDAEVVVSDDEVVANAILMSEHEHEDETAHGHEDAENAHDSHEQEPHDHDSHDHETATLLTPEEEAADRVRAFHAALNAADAQLARSYLDESVLIFEGGGVERSAEEYANHHLKSDIAFLSNMRVTLLEQQVQSNGDFAVSMARSKIQGSYKDKSIDIETMETIALKKIDGEWLITHIHWSN